MKKSVGMENSKEAVFILKNGIPIYWAKHWSFDLKKYSIGDKIPFLMNLPSPVDTRVPGLGLSGKLTAVIKFFRY